MEWKAQAQTVENDKRDLTPRLTEHYIIQYEDEEDLNFWSSKFN